MVPSTEEPKSGQMNEDFPAFQDSLPQAGKPSLIRQFTIEGLYGYRTVSLDSEYAATILIAKNGSGKTTLIAALDAFLRGQFLRLQDLEFSRIVCRLRGVTEALILEHSDIDILLEAAMVSELPKQARRMEIEPTDLFTFLEREFDEANLDYRESYENTIVSKIYKSAGYSSKGAIELCRKIRRSYHELVPSLAHLRASITQCLDGVDIVYLPTYRRIELPLEEKEEEIFPHRRRRPRLSFGNRGVFSGDIQFGLADISDRLYQLNQRLLGESNISYREISANIINELIDGTFDREEVYHRSLPEADELNLFFSRLREGGTRVGPFPEVAIPNIDKIYTGAGIPGETNKFLIYFLSKLNAAIQATRDIEVMVEEFVNVCNRYLSQSDSSTVAPHDWRWSEREDNDGKLLRLNRRDLKVYVESIALSRRITLNSLSSGEKQMISLFAKMYLYEKDKIILIDEPELSLSIDWQRQILLDFLRAPRCRQVIAITHSPFVFDNELEPFARSMQTSIDPPLQLPLETDEFDVNGISFSDLSMMNDEDDSDLNE